MMDRNGYRTRGARSPRRRTAGVIAGLFGTARHGGQ